MLTDSLAYLTPDLPGIGGELKQRPEDFLVEEQPLYEPCGEGEHLYIYLEKRELTTTQVIRRIAKVFRIRRGAIGSAGLKDKHAVTRQHLSLWMPGSSDEFIAESLDRIKDDEKITILWAQRHTNKLRRGHHGGNRFVLRVRGVQPTDVVKAKAILDVLETTGIPNYVGDQRFGYRQNSHILGQHLLTENYQAFLDDMLGLDFPIESRFVQAGREHYRKGEFTEALELWPKTLRFDRQALDALRQGKTPIEAVKTIDQNQRQFLIAAWQSDVFNRVLHQRVEAGTLATLLPGDLAWKHDNRSVFAVDEETAQVENAPDGRVALGTVSPSGPLWGSEMMQAQGETAQIEREALDATGVTETQLAGPANAPEHNAPGKRRPMRIMLKDPDLEGGADEHGPYIKASFELTRGAYATMVMREVMKTTVNENA